MRNWRVFKRDGQGKPMMSQQKDHPGPEPNPDIIVPDGIEPYINVRSWVVGSWNDETTPLGEQGVLYSPLRGTPWVPGERLEARCEIKTSKSFELSPSELHGSTPAKICTCGIYALKEVPSCTFTIGWIEGFGVVPVFGRVKQWGNLYRGPNGIRSQYAYPAELWIPSTENAEELAELLSKNYGVDVHIGVPEWGRLTTSGMTARANALAMHPFSPFMTPVPAPSFHRHR